MKRRPSNDLLTMPSAKRNHEEPPSTTMVSPLLVVLEQYGLLVSVVSNLHANDVLSLALTSKAIHQLISVRPKCLETLLAKASCSGKGIRIRSKNHKNSPFFFAYNCTEYVKCGSNENRRAVESRPCSNCKLSTCDECRIHCVYQSIYEEPADPKDPAELPNFSGFVLLEPAEQPILSPHHLYSPETQHLPRWQNPATGTTGPYHDQGFLDVALEESATAPPERIEEVIDVNLGKKSLSAAPYNWSPTLRSLLKVTEARKTFVCDYCFKKEDTAAPKQLRVPPKILPWLDSSKPIGKCHCTLRSRFLDRWLCVGCYQQEETTISLINRNITLRGVDVCKCGGYGTNTVCLWCWGEIETPKLWHPSGS